jgi:tRNA pseudouridine55 synthase
MHGALLVDKPPGPTSHDIVAFARRALKTSAIGHTGTLDPLATGLLVLLIGHATRLSRFLVTDQKEYLADIRLGRSTETYDAQGVEAGGARREAGDARREERGARSVTPEQIAAILPEFLGTFPQLPPPFSAKKVDGVRAYKKARKHEPVELKPVEVTVRELEIVTDRPHDPHVAPRDSHLAPRAPDPTLLRLRIVCSAGFYVRSLAHDIGQLLGCGAHLEALRRTRAGQFRLADAVTLDALQAAGPALESRIVGPNALIPDMPAVTLTGEGKRRALNGNTLAPVHLEETLSGTLPDSRIRVLDAAGALLSVAEMRADGLLHPLLVLR